jgi:hypothetical protein
MAVVDEGPHEPLIRRALAAVDLDAAIREFRAQDHFIFFPELLPDALIARLLDDLARLGPDTAHRVHVPLYRKAGTIEQARILRAAPALTALYRSPALLELANRLAGLKLGYKGTNDAHAATLYVYREAGDHVGWHFDACGCEQGASYTATFGLVNRTTSRVQFELFGKDRARTPRFLSLSMGPGSFVFFRGSSAHHRVTPTRAGDDRVSFSFAYVAPGRTLRGYPRFKENLKDAILYFGPRALVQKNYR